MALNIKVVKAPAEYTVGFNSYSTLMDALAEIRLRLLAAAQSSDGIYMDVRYNPELTVTVDLNTIECYDKDTEVDVYLDADEWLQAGYKIPLIKLVRTASGLGLKEAKDLVEAGGAVLLIHTSVRAALLMENLASQGRTVVGEYKTFYPTFYGLPVS